MAPLTRSGRTLSRQLSLLGLTATLATTTAIADVWVFEPSITLDQRFDDNYYLIPDGDGSLTATRAVGELGLSRETAASSYRGLVRVDGLLTTTNDNGDEGLESNQIAAFEAIRRTARSRYGFLATFTQDTPSRDIAADLSDTDSITNDAAGLDLTQSSNVARQELVLEPSWEYDLSRRLAFDAGLEFTTVRHELPDPQDAIYQRYIDTFPRLADGSFDGTPLSYDEVTIDNVGGVFSPSGELDDFDEAEVELGFRYKYTPITTLTTTVSYSRFEAEVEPDPFAIIPFEDLIPDSDEPGIRRKPRRDSISTTARFKLGVERYLTPTLLFGVEGGVYTNTTDLTDTLRAEDRPNDEIPQELLDSLETESDGWLASLSLDYNTARTRYAAEFSVDVVPSSSGTQVESHELIGQLFHTLSPRTEFSLYARAYEPDRLGANREDRFARRFISFQPKITWKAARNWTVGAAYRYRRQKAQIDPTAAESNAILLSLTYTPPSEARDAAKAL